MPFNKITADHYNERLEEIFNRTKSMKEYDSMKENIQIIIMEELIREDQERIPAKDLLDDSVTCIRI